MKEISTTKTIPSPRRGVCLIHSLLVQKTDLFISCCFPHDHFFTGNSVFWPELCIPASGLVPPRLDPRVPVPEDTGAAGKDGCSSCAGGENLSRLWEPARLEGKFFPLGTPLAKQELLEMLGVRRRPAYCSGHAPRTLVLCWALLPPSHSAWGPLSFTNPSL